MGHHLARALAVGIAVLAGACTPAPAEKESEAASESIGDRSRQLGERCGFDPLDSWSLIESFGGIDRYSIDPANPVTGSPDRGEPGVFVEVTCSSTDGLGGLEFIELPGVTLVEDADVAFGGGDGNRRELHFDDPAFPPALSRIAYVVRVDGSHCQIAADGSVPAVDTAAAELQTVADSLLCRGA